LSDDEFHGLQELETSRRFTEKANHDFSLALEDCYHRSTSPYIALFEGDVLLANGWFARVRMGLEDIQKKMKGKPWLDMRLFNEERSIRWASEHPLGNKVPIIILVTSTVIFAILSMIRRKVAASYLTYKSICAVCFVSVPVFVILFYRAGKASLLPPRPGVSVQDWGCCSQGLVFPREIVPNITTYLRIHAKETAPDIQFLYYGRQEKLPRFVLNPIQVQHMGFSSIINPNRHTKDLLWSVAFENLRPKRLEADHKAMISRLYSSRTTKHESKFD